MAQKTSPEIQAMITVVFVFIITVFVIVLMALYVKNRGDYQSTLSDEAVLQNLTLPGQLYKKQ